MISSEVQRTLVKSAPELWAEVSDPAALARHLGELGDIRITRVEPEQKVEWEACDGDTSGTVVIKPSGWGTKVKLTVTRETTADEASAPPHAHDADDDDLHAEPDVTNDAVLAEPAPTVEAELEPLAEDMPDHLQTSERLGEHEPTVAALELVPEPEPEPRRGFFARLFGRFRGQETAAHKLEADELEAASPEAVAHEPDSLEYALEPHDDAEPAHQAVIAEPVHEPLDAHAAWAAWGEPSETAPAVASQPEPEPGHDLEPAAFAEPPHAPEPRETIEQAFELARPTVEPTHETEAVGAPGQAPSTELHAHADQSDSAPPEPTGISAEIKAAEETAAEDTAVLTGVLDRLGAAHHRPFSRA
jgi:hypothetical protein